MKKMDNKGFMLAEVLIVTVFVASVLIFLFIQFTNLSQGYSKSYKYNTIEAIYALDDIKAYINGDLDAYEKIEEQILTNSYINLIDCEIFSNKQYCLELFKAERIDKIIILKNQENYDSITGLDDGLLDFIDKISNEGNEKYRLVAKFKDSTFATIRFGA